MADAATATSVLEYATHRGTAAAILPGAAAAAAGYLAAAGKPPTNEPPADDDKGRKPDPEKLSVNLVDPAAEALDELVQATGCSKTVITNRAIQYLHILWEAQKKDPRTGARQRILLMDGLGNLTELAVVV